MQFNQNTHQNRRGLSLIEMLIGMAITLVMMAAVVQLFANISQGVRNRRATMEVSAKLRTARAQMYNDLAGATCLKYPKDTHAVMPKPDSNNMPDGYFEIVEGQWFDEDPGGTFDPATSLIPSSSRPFDADGAPLDPNIVTDGRGLGDYDDILAMTVESQTERFKGRGRGLRPGGNPNLATDWIDMAISSPEAEVIWFAVQTPARTDPAYLPEMGEPGMRKVYRRVVLITPWYGTVTNSYGTGSDPYLDLSGIVDTNPDVQRQRRLDYLRTFQETYDISVRLENDRLVPNTLADLARREHRFAHSPNSNTAPPNFAFYPHQFPYNILASTDFLPANADNASLRRLQNDREGEDLILDDVLAFDIQVFDPGAPIFNYLGTTVQPSGRRDDGTATAFINAVQAYTANPSGSAVLTGYGMYADLGWNNSFNYDHTAIAGAPTPLFQQERRLGWHPSFPLLVTGTPNGIPCVYDTWTTYYETDQTNQQAAPFYTFANSTVPWDATWQLGIIDQGANGLDEPAFYDHDNNPNTAPVLMTLNGPDDPNERETSPPYPYPLYGVQVKIRLYEPESRQIRETTVTRNLSK